MRTPATTPISLRRLRDLNTDDVLKALGLGPWFARWPTLRRLFDRPSLALARRLAAFDEQVRQGQATAAANKLLGSWGTRVEATGAPLVTTGPRLYVANHPGLGDMLALLTLLDQNDLRIVARDRPFLRALPGLQERLFLITDEGSFSVLRRVRAHLAAGGAVLTFPAGRIEPDPAWTDSSVSLQDWSSSTAVWTKTVPGLVVQPLVVAGVRHQAFVDPWFARWRPRSERDWTAAVAQLSLQVLLRRPRNHRISVAVGEPLTASTDLVPRVLDLSQRLLRLRVSR